MRLVAGKLSEYSMWLPCKQVSDWAVGLHVRFRAIKAAVVASASCRWWPLPTSEMPVPPVFKGRNRSLSFGNPAKLDLLPPNSRGFATSAHAKCAIYRLGSKTRCACQFRRRLGGIKANTPRCEQNCSPPRFREYRNALNIVNQYFLWFNYSDT